MRSCGNCGDERSLWVELHFLDYNRVSFPNNFCWAKYQQPQQKAWVQIGDFIPSTNKFSVLGKIRRNEGNWWKVNPLRRYLPFSLCKISSHEK